MEYLVKVLFFFPQPAIWQVGGQ